ncbi:MAG: 4-(cytidine 5'-diphospho)-2-C-methyl-D-erythritol kinase [Bacillota bacterium]
MNGPMDEVSRKAFSKVNLTLRVLGKRQDGYHEVSTVMVPVSLHDVLTFRPGGEGLSVICPGLPDLLTKDNLVTKAAQAVLDVSGSSLDLTITVEKAIPAGGGMGGGSSDAAATLLSVNECLPEEKRLRPGRLLKVAATIGSDVPFFLGCNSAPPAWTEAVCTGTGADVMPLPKGKVFDLVLALPGFSVNTAQAYKDWDTLGRAAGDDGEAMEQDVLRALQSGDSAALALCLVNDLEAPVSLRHPAISALKRRMMQCGALGASMTGSGSAVYGVCRSKEHAAEVKLRMQSFVQEFDLKGLIALRTGCEV